MSRSSFGGIMSHSEKSDALVFFVNGRKVVEKNADPEVDLLFYLRKRLRLTGTKYGCGGGGCGACTVMISRYDSSSKKIRHFSVTACLIPICSLYGAAVTTVEGIGSTKTRIHPVQERIAKGHGTQCGFCTPGMVMSIYTLLRNHLQPSTEQLIETLGGNLCRCTGYRPIIESGKSFSTESSCCQMKGTGTCCLDQEEKKSENKTDVCNKLYQEEEFLPLDPTQELIFPPELMRMAEEAGKKTLVFRGERVAWISPATLNELLELKLQYPQAPLVMGNTFVGPNMKFKGVYHPFIISPARILELNVVMIDANKGLTIGAGCSLAQVKEILTETVLRLPAEKTQTYRALLKHLKTIAGQQIRNMATLGGHIISRLAVSDLNPVLGVGNCVLNLATKEGTQQLPLNDHFLAGSPDANLTSEQVLVSVFIPLSKKWEFVSAFRQAQRQQNALAIVNSGMRVHFKDGTNIIMDLNILYGGVSSATVSANKSCQQLIGRAWNEEMLDEACRLVLDEVTIPGSSSGGMVEYKRTLMISFLFKFYLEVLQELNVRDPRYPDVPNKFQSVLEDFPLTAPCGTQAYECVDSHQPPQDPVGRPVMHQSGIKHATGEAIFCDDMPAIDEELFLAVVTSTRPHAKIISIDASEALALPGVVDVITAQDVPGENGNEEERIYAQNEVICVGQIVCTVAADSYFHAKQAAKKVNIVYEDMEPVIVTIKDAVNHKSFIGSERKLEQGNIKEAFQTVDQIIEGEVHVGGQEHFYMETQSVLVIPKTEDKEMEIYVSSQDAAFVQEKVASTLGIPKNRIMCHMRRAGGGFGGKMTKPGLLGAVAAVAANKTGCPIRFILERGDDMLITGGRHPLLGKYKIGFMNNGKIKAADIKYYINGGCTPDESEMVIEYALLKLENAYKIPNLRIQGQACKTNLPSNTAFRGFGFPQGTFVTEYWITAVAAKCNLPPEKVRELNMYKTVDRTIHKQQFDPKNLIRCWDECMEKSSYYSRKKATELFNHQNSWKKRGIAIIPMKFSVGYPKTYYHQAASLVHIYTDGSVLITHGGTELGQGLNTKMIQVASHELKIPMSDVYLSEMNTVTVPNTVATAGSVGADVNGKAVQTACQTLMKRLEPIINKNPNGTWKEWANEAFAQSISLSATGYFRGYKADMDWVKGEGDVFPYFVYGAACSEVEIDCLTGAHKNIRTDIVMDACFSINPAIDIGQIEGAFTQGVGLYTLEELKYSPEGVLHTRSPNEYKIPSITDIPEELNVSLLTSTRNPIAIYSSKGLGESGMFLGSSVFFALLDAVTAARKERGLTETFIMNSPATPELIRMTCMDKFTNLIPRDDPKSYKPWSIPVA
ncbi:aldehyde oxidase 3-like isoform X1 [Dromiciops gliroides]|uniref:aldehyde oxidase 3-like isoform X1 n=1 Tax=Dromiciops gliroides TaxID=33562 RepID=UPI001CC5D2C7|nr:aldehyde oxidase 3-like isoform X1 [Dromiciops gliroides]